MYLGASYLSSDYSLLRRSAADDSEWNDVSKSNWDKKTKWFTGPRWRGLRAFWQQMRLNWSFRGWLITMIMDEFRDSQQREKVMENTETKWKKLSDSFIHFIAVHPLYLFKWINHFSARRTFQGKNVRCYGGRKKDLPGFEKLFRGDWLWWIFTALW